MQFTSHVFVFVMIIGISEDHFDHVNEQKADSTLQNNVNHDRWNMNAEAECLS